MASSIFFRTIAAVADGRILMNNSRWARPIGFTWNKIRIGVRWQVAGSTNIIGTPRMVIGVCAGSAAIYGDASVGHFVGTRQNEPTWTITGGNRYLVNGNTWECFKRIGVADTAGSGSLGLNAVQWGIGPNAATPTANRSVFILDITKGSPYTLQIMLGWNNSDSGGAAPTDVSRASFLQTMMQSTPTLAQHRAGTARTLTVNEATNGTLDHVNMHWNQAGHIMEICDWAIGKIS